MSADPTADLVTAEGILTALAQIDERAEGEIERAAQALKQLAQTDQRVGEQRAEALRARPRR